MSTPMLLLYILIIVALLYLMLAVIFDNTAFNLTYDETRVRYKRIRDQYIEKINQLKLPKNELQNVIDDIHYIDNAINNVSKNLSIFEKIKNYVSKNVSSKRQEIILQQLVEQIIHNDLFLKSKELELLTNNEKEQTV